jgi:hypothetical protein
MAAQKNQYMPKSGVISTLRPLRSVQQITPRMGSAYSLSSTPFCWSRLLKPTAINTWFLLKKKDRSLDPQAIGQTE